MRPLPLSSWINKTSVEPTSLYHAYLRAPEIGRARKLASTDYSEIFIFSAPDISRSDNEVLARSACDITQGMQSLSIMHSGKPESFIKQLLRIVFRFAGEPITEDIVGSIYQEASKANSSEPGDLHGSEL